jgi:hypothetical protein
MGAHRQALLGVMSWREALVRQRSIAAVTVIFVCAILAHAGSTQDCPALDDKTTARALQVMARKMGTEPVLPIVDNEAFVPEAVTANCSSLYRIKRVVQSYIFRLITISCRRPCGT